MHVKYRSHLSKPWAEHQDDLEAGQEDLYGACRSRLGCQVIAAPELDGIKVRIPGATRNFAVDGYKPKPH